MIARGVRPRSGITLTEILISILIMGIGMISLAVLFPLGLLKLRDAARYHRSGLLAQSASDDFDARALLTKESFTRTWYGPLDPFTSDQVYGPFTNPVQSLGPNSTGLPQPGLPICYDPYWRAFTQVVPYNTNAPPAYPTTNALFDKTLIFVPTATTQAAEARFGAAVVASGNNAVNVYNVRASTGDTNGYPSAYGLQRITNFIPANNGNNSGLTYLYPFTYGLQGTGVVADTFISADDIVFNSRDNGTTGLSPLLPDLKLSANPANPSPVQDYRYSWFFTGRQVDSTNGTMFQGDVVVCDGRQFGFAPLPGGSINMPTSETVVEAVFGYSDKVGALGFSVGADKTVLLRWPTSIPDPNVRIGGWIADVTYERNAQTSISKAATTQTSYQRCNWYQVTKRIDAQVDPDFGINFRRMILTIASPVKTKTALTSGGIPLYSNAALIMPSVINVYPRAFSQ
jgi:hypothetical protein